MSAQALDVWREDAVASFATALRTHARKVNVGLNPALLVKDKTRHPMDPIPKTPPRQPPVAKPSRRDLTMAARRAGAEEALARRKRTAALGDALRTPLIHAFLAEWQDRCADGYRALQLWHQLAFRDGMARWRRSHASTCAVSQHRLLCRWRIVTRAADRRKQLTRTFSADHERRVLRCFISNVEAALFRSRVSFAAADAAHEREMHRAAYFWRRLATTRAGARRVLVTRSALRTLRREARLSTAAAAGPAKVALARWRRQLNSEARRRDLFRAMPVMRSRCASRAEERGLTRTLTFAAMWHRKSSALQHALALLLLHGWRRRESREKAVSECILGTRSRLVLAMSSWRAHAISDGERRTTREAIKRAGGFYAEGGGAVGGGGAAGGGDPAGRMLLEWAAQSIASPGAPMRHQRPAVAKAQKRADGGADSTFALLDALVRRDAKLDESWDAQAALTQAELTSAPAAAGPPSRPPSRRQPLAQRRASLEKHQAKIDAAAAPRSDTPPPEDNVEHSPPPLAPPPPAAGMAGAMPMAGGPPANASGPLMDAGMAQLRQRLALDVPLPSYLSLPPAHRGAHP